MRPARFFVYVCVNEERVMLFLREVQHLGTIVFVEVYAFYAFICLLMCFVWMERWLVLERQSLSQKPQNL